jgi:hypothetical protein
MQLLIDNSSSYAFQVLETTRGHWARGMFIIHRSIRGLADIGGW